MQERPPEVDWERLSQRIRRDRAERKSHFKVLMYRAGKHREKAAISETKEGREKAMGEARHVEDYAYSIAGGSTRERGPFTLTRALETSEWAGYGNEAYMVRGRTRHFEDLPEDRPRRNLGALDFSSSGRDRATTVELPEGEEAQRRDLSPARLTQEEEALGRRIRWR